MEGAWCSGRPDSTAQTNNKTLEKPRKGQLWAVARSRVQNCRRREDQLKRLLPSPGRTGAAALVVLVLREAARLLTCLRRRSSRRNCYTISFSSRCRLSTSNDTTQWLLAQRRVWSQKNGEADRRRGSCALRCMGPAAATILRRCRRKTSAVPWSAIAIRTLKGRRQAWRHLAGERYDVVTAVTS
jgi:hypothetical protein